MNFKFDFIRQSTNDNKIVYCLFSGKLFHRVILMSGSALSPWAVVRDTSATTTHVAEALNCSLDGRFTSGGRHQTLLQCLRSVPLYQLMRVRPAPPGSGSPFRPVWGPSFDGVVVHSFRNRMRDYLERMAR
jgi:neuroligin